MTVTLVMERSDRILLTVARTVVAVKACTEANPAAINQVHFTGKYLESI
jgi:hypothetical protein